MKEKISKHFLVVILNTIPFWLACVFYKTGAGVILLFPLLQLLLNAKNLKYNTNATLYLCFNSVMLLASIGGILLNTHLYNLHNGIFYDSESELVRKYFVLAAVAFVTMLTFVSLVYRLLRSKYKR